MRQTDSIWTELTTLLAGASRARCDPRDVRRDTALEDGLDLSSLMVVNLLIDLEEKFGITILDDELSKQNIVTAGDLSDLIAARLGACR